MLTKIPFGERTEILEQQSVQQRAVRATLNTLPERQRRLVAAGGKGGTFGAIAGPPGSAGADTSLGTVAASTGGGAAAIGGMVMDGGSRTAQNPFLKLKMGGAK